MIDTIKTFIWNNFIFRYYEDWLQEYAQEYFNDKYEPVAEEPLWNDLD